MSRRRQRTISDDEVGLLWLAVGDGDPHTVLRTIELAIAAEGARDPQGVLRWLRSALTLRDLGALPRHIGFFCVAVATEHIAMSRIDRDPELRRLSELQRQRARELGVDEAEWDYLSAQPPDVRALSDAWSARADALEVEVLTEAGAREEAMMRRHGFPFDERREEGRAALFGPSVPFGDDPWR